MSKLRVGLLSLIVLVQGLTLVGGFMAYQQMSEEYWELMLIHKKMLRQYAGIIIEPGMPPNPLILIAHNVPLLLLVLFGASLAIVLLVDEVQGRKW